MTPLLVLPCCIPASAGFFLFILLCGFSYYGMFSVRAIYARVYFLTIGVLVMADKPVVVSLDLSVLDRQWLRKSLETQRAAIVRSRTKEMEGSPVLRLRDEEVSQINSILARL